MRYIDKVQQLGNPDAVILPGTKNTMEDLLWKMCIRDRFVPSHATGDVDTDLAEKAGMAARLSEAYDFVLLHLNGADEASHRRNRCLLYTS